MLYSDALTFVTAGLTGLGYGTTNHPDLPAFNMGPGSIQKIQKSVSPNAVVFLTVGGGIGLAHEGLYEQPFITVRVLGPQNDYQTAEQIAYDIDGLMLAVDSPRSVGTCRTLYITRNASPQLVDLDEADRYHFQTTYITETKR